MPALADAANGRHGSPGIHRRRTLGNTPRLNATIYGRLWTGFLSVRTVPASWWWSDTAPVVSLDRSNRRQTAMDAVGQRLWCDLREEGTGFAQGKEIAAVFTDWFAPPS